MIKIEYFIEYEGKIFAYRSYGGKMAGPLTKENFGTRHNLIEVPIRAYSTFEEQRKYIKRKYSDISYRLIDDNRIPKWIKERIMLSNAIGNILNLMIPET